MILSHAHLVLTEMRLALTVLSSAGNAQQASTVRKQPLLLLPVTQDTTVVPVLQFNQLAEKDSTAQL
jgi:hypothetical protein